MPRAGLPGANAADQWCAPGRSLLKSEAEDGGRRPEGKAGRGGCMRVPEPSEWARKRLGDAAADLQRLVPLAVQRAHDLALAAHLAGTLRTNDTYGSTLLVTQHEQLVEFTRDVSGVVARKPLNVGGRFEFAVLDSTATVLYPWRYATDSHTRRQDAKMRKPLSELRKTMLALAPRSVDAQLTLDQANLEPEDLQAQIEEEQAVLEQLAEFGQVVTVGFASNPMGIFALGWGDAELVDEKTGAVAWHHWEPFSAAGPATGESDGGARPSPIRPADGSGRAGRFDDAPLNESLGLTPRAPLSAPPTGESEPPQPESGSESPE